MSRAPVWAISHGGPPSMYDTLSEPYKAWQKIGRSILADHAAGVIKGLVCVSAHWEYDGDGEGVWVNSDSTNPLVYDFYGFPAHYYKETFPSSSAPLRQPLLSTLSTSSIPTHPTPRGLDHGLWVPFRIMFPSGAPPSLPIIQVSMVADGLPDQGKKNRELGEALGVLRVEGYAVVATGQGVHNLRAFIGARSRGLPTKSPTYTSFLSTLSTALTSPLPELTAAVEAVRHGEGYKEAHPTDEHFMPFVVAAGAAAGGNAEGEGEVGKVVFELDEGALGWLAVRWA